MEHKIIFKDESKINGEISKLNAISKSIYTAVKALKDEGVDMEGIYPLVITDQAKLTQIAEQQFKDSQATINRFKCVGAEVDTTPITSAVERIINRLNRMVPYVNRYADSFAFDADGTPHICEATLTRISEEHTIRLSSEKRAVIWAYALRLEALLKDIHQFCKEQDINTIIPTSPGKLSALVIDNARETRANPHAIAKIRADYFF